MKRAVEAAIRIGAIAGLIVWCFIIARPFLIPIVWGAIIAVAIFHGYEKLRAALGGRRITAAVLITLLMLVLLVAPSVLLGDSLVSGARYAVDSFQSGELHIPPPPDSVAHWPLIGEPIAKAWTLASEDLEAALRQASPLLKGFGSWLLGAAGGAGLALLQFVLAISSPERYSPILRPRAGRRARLRNGSRENVAWSSRASPSRPCAVWLAEFSASP